MTINWPILSLVALLLIGLVAWMIARNQVDEKDLKNKLNNDYPKEKEHRETHDYDELKG